MIVVIGASGNVGREVVTRLLERGLRPRALTRNPQGAAFAPGVEVLGGDLDDPGTADRALDGADAAFVATAGPAAPAHDEALARAVARCGVPRVVRVSSVAALPPVTDAYGTAHAAAEEAYRATGTACTFLRPAAFMSNTLQWAWSVKADGTMHQPFGDLPQAVVDPADVAEVAVRTLTEPGHEGKAYTLTGPEPLTARDRAHRLAQALGRPLTFVDASEEEAHQAMVKAGLPDDYVTALLTALGDPTPARGAVPLPTVEELTGRPPRRFDTWLKTNLHHFR
ncbi:nucleotide-diphosphate-sugar epimerase [Streptomyces mashuensis]|uniref:Nucleotide-diphosphate-sugar epimerase n=1 Tax=Streptomyces mashuensis TaxID=33904 RepID=A0A919B7V9_9ACTN|nr:NAD(P)H-binding protein [Streptomyces mashuensis]GHF65548.1 nucleotide-diphosphate-sugar epimerase [Streptomyces mashuensis]